MTRASCVPFADGERMVIVRQSFLDLCEGDACRAAVLQHLVYWTDNKLAHAKQAGTHNRLVDAAGEGDRWPTDTWVYKSRDELAKELFGMWGDNRCAAALKWLIEQEIVEARQNPVHKWDRTLQYRIRVDDLRRRLEPINARVRAMESPSDKENLIAPYRASSAPNGAIDCPLQGNGEPPTGQAIPKIPTKIPTKIDSGAGAAAPSPRIHGAVPQIPEPEPETTEPVQARSSPNPLPPTPSPVVEIADGWVAADLDRLKALVGTEYPPSGQAGYRPSKADLDLLAALPRERARDFVKAVRNYARKTEGQETKWTRGLRRFLADGFWEQFVKTQSAARKVTAQAPGRDINAEADAASHAVKLQNTYIPAFDKSRQEAV